MTICPRNCGRAAAEVVALVGVFSVLTGCAGHGTTAVEERPIHCDAPTGQPSDVPFKIRLAPVSAPVHHGALTVETIATLTNTGTTRVSLPVGGLPTLDGVLTDQDGTIVTATAMEVYLAGGQGASGDGAEAAAKGEKTAAAVGALARKPVEPGTSVHLPVTVQLARCGSTPDEMVSPGRYRMRLLLEYGAVGNPETTTALSEQSIPITVR